MPRRGGSHPRPPPPPPPPKKKTPASLELQGSLPHPQETINGHYLTQWNSVYIPKPSHMQSSFDVLQLTCYRHISYSPCMTHNPHNVLFDLISLETMLKQYKFSCSHFAVFVQTTVTFCLLHASDLNVPCCSNTLCLSHIMKEPMTPPLILSKKKQEYEN